jgi:membrane protease YdiL (CAAX protease family)
MTEQPGESKITTASVFDTKHAALRYTTLRLALFLVALFLVWGIATIFNMDLGSQLSKLTLLAIALLLSSAASFLILSKQRDAMSAGLVARSERLGRKFGDAAALEDDEDE